MSTFEIIDNDMTEMSEAEEIQYLNCLLKKSKDGEIVWDEIIYDNYEQYSVSFEDISAYLLYNTTIDKMYVYIECSSIKKFGYIDDERHIDIVNELYLNMTTIIRDSSYFEYTKNYKERDNKPYELVENVNYNYEILGNK